MKRLLALALCGALLAACGDDDNGTGPESPSVVGAWTLTQIDGQALPTSITVEQTTLTVTAGTLTFAANARYSGAVTFQEIGSVPDQGAYTQTGSTVVLTSDTQGVDPGTATVSGNTLTLQYGSPPSGPTFTFTK